MPFEIDQFHTKTAGALNSSQEDIKLADVGDMATEIDAGNVVFLTMYTATRSEVVMVRGVEGNTLDVMRGADGTDAQPWPCDVCVDALRIRPRPTCDEGETEGDAGSAGRETILFVEGQGCIDVGRVDNTITVRLKPTGVVPGNYGGLTVNECGLISNIEEGWPNVIDFDPCAC